MPEKISEKEFCNCVAWDKGIDPIGQAGNITRMLALEAPLPWQPQVPDSLPPYFRPVYQYAKRLNGDAPGEAMGVSNLALLVPNGADGKEEHGRILVWERPHGRFAELKRIEYLVPNERLTDLCWALTFQSEGLAQFDRYRVGVGAKIRDFLVCTHGARDAACGKFGFQLYEKLMREAPFMPDVRVWRTSHFGGHVFSPTMIEMPTGLYWGHLHETNPIQVLTRSGDAEALKGHLRGWTGAPRGFAQAADRQMLMTYGWEWLDTPRVIRVSTPDQSENHDGGEWVYVEMETPHVTFLKKVTITHTIETNSSSSKLKLKRFPQYEVTDLTP